MKVKWALKGSATCVLNFDEATGYMIGEKDRGLNAMFTMMNLERIVVGIQGLRYLRNSLSKLTFYMQKRENKEKQIIQNQKWC